MCIVLCMFHFQRNLLGFVLETLIGICVNFKNIYETTICEVWINCHKIEGPIWKYVDSGQLNISEVECGLISTKYKSLFICKFVRKQMQ
jgi:hypothetical protein